MIKLFFYLHFFVWLITMYNKDKVAPLNLPLPFIWALSPFFPTGAPHTPFPRGGNTPVAREGSVCSTSPCALSLHTLCFQSRDSHGPRSLPAQGSCLWAELCLYFKSRFSATSATFQMLGELTSKHLGWASSQNGCPV